MSALQELLERETLEMQAKVQERAAEILFKLSAFEARSELGSAVTAVYAAVHNANTASYSTNGIDTNNAIQGVYHFIYPAHAGFVAHAVSCADRLISCADIIRQHISYDDLKIGD